MKNALEMAKACISLDEVCKLSELPVDHKERKELADIYREVVDNDFIILSRKKKISTDIVCADWISKMISTDGMVYFLKNTPYKTIRFTIDGKPVSFEIRSDRIQLLEGGQITATKEQIIALCESNPGIKLPVHDGKTRLAILTFHTDGPVVCLDMTEPVDIKSIF